MADSKFGEFLDPLGLGLHLLLLLTIFALVLDILVVNVHGLVDLGAQGVVIIDAVFRLALLLRTETFCRKLTG